jgi:hypothetical protein
MPNGWREVPPLVAEGTLMLMSFRPLMRIGAIVLTLVAAYSAFRGQSTLAGILALIAALIQIIDLSITR